VPVADPPFATVVPVAAAGADSPLAAVVEATLSDPPLAEEPAEVAGTSALDPVAVVEAVVPALVVAVESGWFDALSEDFWVLMPKPRITAAMMIATTANPTQRERFTEPRNRLVTGLYDSTQPLEMQRFWVPASRSRSGPPTRP
jgi:hypothetical protein